MTKATVFIQVQDKSGIVEADLSLPATVGDVRDALKAHGIEIGKDMEIFVDDAEEPEKQDKKDPLDRLKHGSRIHLTRCKRIKVTVNYLEKTIDRPFPPGARVRAVKRWAVDQFKLNPKDAGEHVLQLCGSTKQPPADTPLAELVQGHGCELCFDLVPEKRVEG